MTKMGKQIAKITRPVQVLVAAFTTASIVALAQAEHGNHGSQTKLETGVAVTGVLLLAHGGKAAWNEEVNRLASQVNEKRPVEVAFGMANKRNIQSAIDRLLARGVGEIVAVPLFVSSHSSLITSTEYLLGLRRQAPPELAIYARMDHGQGNNHVSNARDASLDATTPVESPVPVRMADALNHHPIVADILLSRARSISQKPDEEVVVVVAHGPVADEENAKWLSDMKALVEMIKGSSRFKRIEYLTVRDDAPEPIRSQAAGELRGVVERATAEGSRVLIVPLLLAYGGIEEGIKKRLEGLEYTMCRQALLPDERLARWVLLAARPVTPLALTDGQSGGAKGSAEYGTIRGRVVVGPSDAVARNAVVTIAELRRSVLTDETGAFEFGNVPAGRYQIIAHLDRVPDVAKSVEVAGGTYIVDFELTLAPISEQVTVTASGSAEAVGSSYHSVTSVGAVELAQRNPISIGEALEYQLGVAKRSFGPGTGRPVIRGFDGDRVLVLQDGLRVGGIASQSGDEVEPIDVLALDRVEIVKGPATLLYGSNAIGGVVNGISTNDVYQKGLSGYLTAAGGTNNWQAGASGGFKYGTRNFLIFGHGGGQKANDYRSASEIVLNSFARTDGVSGGAAWFPRNGWLSFNYSYDRRHHGLPVEPGEVDFESLRERRHGFEVKGGFRGLGGFIESGDFALRYNDYIAREFEFESDENVTELEGVAFNKNFNYRANFNSRRRGRSYSTFGLSGFTRDFESTGAEAPAPRTSQNSLAVYALQRVDFERIGFQFGGRVEQTGYDPRGDLRSRKFVGFSGSAGMRIPLWVGGSFVANYQHSFRAPALEELYNNGPHPGILLFDIGNPDLTAESGDGIDLSIRHNDQRVRIDGSFFYYHLRNFVFPAFTGATDDESNLPIVNYTQGTSRYVGAEASVEAGVLPTLWLTGKVDYVRAELTRLDKPLPRIPPLRGMLGLDWRYHGVSLRPELILANRQGRVFDHETPTAGYALFNLSTSYTFVVGRVAHIVSVGVYNLGDSLYRNHLSFTKEIAPEMGRSVRLNYSMRF